MKPDSPADRIGRVFANRESVVAGALGLFVGLLLAATWTDGGAPLGMVLGLAGGMIVGTVIHRLRRDRPAEDQARGDQAAGA